MHRRAFLAAAGTLVAAPRYAWPQQQSKAHRIAIIENTDPVSVIRKGAHPYWGAALEGLEAVGLVEGRNLVIERYSGDAKTDQYPALAATVVGTKPDLIWPRGQRQLLYAFAAATDAIPIVTVSGVVSGLVTSLARPGGNVTGFTIGIGPEINGKRLQLLLGVVDDTRRVAYLTRRVSWERPSAGVTAVRKAADRLDITVVPALHDPPVSRESYRAIFAAMANDLVDGVVVSPVAENQNFRETITRLAAEARLPAIYPFPVYMEVGGLMSYGADNSDQFRRAAEYVDRILKGADPGELPIQQPTKFDLIINLQTAREIGITFPTEILRAATKVIE